MAANNISIIVDVVTKGEGQAKVLAQSLDAGFKKAKTSIDAFNAAAGRGQQTLKSMTSGVDELVKAYVGIAAAQKAFTGMIDILKKSEQSQFNLKASVMAANREFKNTGSLEYWESTIKGLSKELQVYSESSLRSAVSRTVDMTKRLGLGADQMTEVIKRTADLSAGKIELNDGIERVTSALRGEAEASEYLGLTLNETYVKSWYDAHNATQTAWKDLTDIQKAQARYQIFLEQTAAFQGKAADSAKTFGGALQLISKNIEDAVTNNKDLAAAMTDVANFIRENADSIGSLAADLITLTAQVAKFAIEWQDVIKILGALWIAGKGIGFITSMVEGMGGAIMFLRGQIPTLVRLGTAASGSATAITGLAGAMTGGLAVAAAAALIPIGMVVYKFFELIEVEKLATEANKDRIAIEDKANKKATEIGKSLGLNVTTLDQFNKLIKEGKVHWDNQTQSWQKGKGALQEVQKTTGLTEEAMKSLTEKVKAMGEAYDGIRTNVGDAFDFAAQKTQILANNERQANEVLITIGREKMRALVQLAQQEAAEKQRILQSSGANAKQQAEVEKQINQSLIDSKLTALKGYRDKLASAIQFQISEEKRYAAEVLRIQKEIASSRMTYDEKVRELKRKFMSEEQVWIDKQKQAYATLNQAQLAFAQAKTPDDLARAAELAKKAMEQAEGIATEVKQGEQTVVSLGKGVGEAMKIMQPAQQILEQSMQKQADLIKQNQEGAKTSGQAYMDELNKVSAAITELNQQKIDITAEIKVDSAAIDAKLRELDGKTTTSTHIIYEQTVSQNATGGPIGFAQGGWNRLRGKLSGYGGGDRIRALLEAGEFVVRKEAVAKYGAGLFGALNAMKINLADAFAGVMPHLPRMTYATGGPVSAGDYGTLRLQAGGVELPVQVSGPKGRDLVREFEAALRKERLVKGR